MPHQLLLADDSVTIQRVIKLTFADEDIEVVTVGDGNQAVEAIDRQPPDIVLADVAMPGRSGYEVAQHIRTSPGLAHIPVLLLTGAFEPVDEARASEIGCDGVLAKPFEPDAVVSRVKELLSRPKAAAAKPLATPAPKATPVVAAAPPTTALPASVPPPLVFPANIPAPAAAPAAVVASVDAPRQAPSDVDAYFDRLDQAFATLDLSPRASADAPTASADPVQALRFAQAGVASASSPSAPAASASSLALDDVFTALTAATTPSAPAPVASARPTASPTPVPAPQGAALTLTEAQLEHIVNRVLERLTARLGNPAEIVANVAERVVREEIAQIKGRM